MFYDVLSELLSSALTMIDAKAMPNSPDATLCHIGAVRTSVSVFLLLALPEAGHVLERLALRLRHEAPYEQGSDEADRGVEAVGEPVAEVVALSEVHVEHGHERRRDDEVEDPLEGHGDGHGSATDGVGEDLGDEHPADGAPREHERGAVDHDREHRHHLEAGMTEGEGDAQCADAHADGAADEEGLAAQLLDGEDGDEGEEDVDHAHDDRVDHRVGHAHVAEDAGRVVEHGVDADGLLEDAEHDAHEDAEVAVGEEALGADGDGLLDVLQDLPGFLRAVDLGKDAEGLLVSAHHDEIARRLRDEADEQGEESCGDGLRSEHIAPAGLDGPGVGARCDGVDALSDLLDDGVGVVAEDEEVDEVDDELSEDDGKLVPRDEHAADVAGCHLADVHRTDGRGQSDADAANDAIDVEHDEQRIRGHAMLEEQELRLHRAQGGDEEQHTGNDEGALAAQPGGQQSAQRRADDASNEGRGGGEAVHVVSVLEVLCSHEEGLQAFLGARDDGRVVAEEQSAQHGHHDD